MSDNFNNKQANSSSNESKITKGEHSTFLPGVRNKRMQSQFSTLLQPRKYDAEWLDTLNTLKR